MSPLIGILIAVGVPILFAFILYLRYWNGKVPIRETDPGGDTDEERELRHMVLGPISLNLSRPSPPCKDADSDQ